MTLARHSSVIVLAGRGLERLIGLSGQIAASLQSGESKRVVRALCIACELHQRKQALFTVKDDVLSSLPTLLRQNNLRNRKAKNQ